MTIFLPNIFRKPSSTELWTAICGCKTMRKPTTFKVAKCDLKRTTHIQQQILNVRGQRVMLDADLALLYGVTTKQLNQQLKRNLKHFRQTLRFD